ncbi:AP-1 complex subunit gamma-1 [Platanthera guangdongensis]|uniref:AP-1 complex subunit gamma-1 n=1 Tax=Platanthera guangdongensis TaxID=2320717 RepID=A0ABR2MFJ2_9ASPA
MDLLSIGSPIQNDSSLSNSVSTGAVNSSAVSSLASLSSLTSQSTSVSPEASIVDPLRGMDQIKRQPPSTASIVDLMDGLLNHVVSVAGSEKLDFMPITAFENNSLKTVFSFTKFPGRPQVTQIKATFTNKSLNSYTDFIFQAAVPKSTGGFDVRKMDDGLWSLAGQSMKASGTKQQLKRQIKQQGSHQQLNGRTPEVSGAARRALAWLRRAMCLEHASGAHLTNSQAHQGSPWAFQALHLDPASSSTLPPSGNGFITQSLSITNNQHGQKPLAMRIRIAYKVNNRDVLEQGQINSFPPGM